MSGSKTADTTPSETSGSSKAPKMSESQVRRDLQDHGYSNVSNLQRSGADWTGSAVDNTGRPVNFDVDDYGVIVIVQ